jgi:isoamylase
MATFVTTSEVSCGGRGLVAALCGPVTRQPRDLSAQGTRSGAERELCRRHDGFTVNDLVSYEHKHNEANGEDNRDGADDNRSWNCGVEGPTTDPEIERLRNRQVKNFVTITLLSLGLPMFLMGDEVRRTQHGNNNAYCQDNEMNWLDWSLLEDHADVRRFLKFLIARRLLRDTGPERKRMTLTQLIRDGIKGWHGVRLNQPEWSNQSRSVALSVELSQEGLLVYLIFNAHWQPLDFELPTIDSGTGNAWRRWIDTFQQAPEDIMAWHEAPAVHRGRAGPRSVIALWLALRTERSTPNHDELPK